MAVLCTYDPIPDLVPYRIHIRGDADALLDRLVDLGALDAERDDDGGLTALMPDAVTPEDVAAALERDDVTVAPAIGRDDGSVWILSPRALRVGRVRIVPAGTNAAPGALRLLDAPAFGTGLHPTTALCLEAIDEMVEADRPARLLDVGTGSGVLALAALTLGVPRAAAIDVDGEAVRAAAANAHINGMRGRLLLVRGGTDALAGTWPLVVANVLAAPLIEMAPSLVRRVGRHGRLVLSGVPVAVEEDVARTYRRLGMRHLGTTARSGWVALLLQATW
jgi:ribosomal protein L11 methyltransferase